MSDESKRDGAQVADSKPISGRAMMYLAECEPGVVDVARRDIEHALACLSVEAPDYVPIVCVHPTDHAHVAAAVQLAKPGPGQKIRVLIDSDHPTGKVTIATSIPEYKDEHDGPDIDTIEDLRAPILDGTTFGRCGDLIHFVVAEDRDRIGACPKCGKCDTACTCCLPGDSTCLSPVCRNRGVDMVWTPEGWATP